MHFVTPPSVPLEWEIHWKRQIVSRWVQTIRLEKVKGFDEKLIDIGFSFLR
jgi:hypothetical protein